MLYFLKGLSTNTNINAFLPQKMNNIMILGRWIYFDMKYDSKEYHSILWQRIYFLKVKYVIFTHTKELFYWKIQYAQNRYFIR